MVFDLVVGIVWGVGVDIGVGIRVDVVLELDKGIIVGLVEVWDWVDSDLIILFIAGWFGL